MRHLKHHQSLGVTREHRAALLSNLAAALIRHGRIETTLTKARALRPFIEKVITKAKKAAAAVEKKDAIHLRRTALRKVRDEDAITLLFNEKAAQFAKRNGGYTRIYKLAPRRIGDSAEMALIELVGAEDPGYKKRGKRGSSKKAEKTETPAAEAVAPAAEATTPATEAVAPVAEAAAPATEPAAPATEPAAPATEPAAPATDAPAEASAEQQP
jgi:large subunit ribosomal protein L17